MIVRIIETFVFNAEMLPQLRYHQRVQLARSMTLDEKDNGVWDLIMALGELRNELAHKLESPKRKQKFDQLKAIYLRELDEELREEHIKSLPDKYVVLFSGAMCLGFLSNFEAEMKRFRAAVDELDKKVNPHRHKPKAKPAT